MAMFMEAMYTLYHEPKLLNIRVSPFTAHTEAI